MEVEQKLGKSLDDLIKETKKPRAAGGKKGAKGKGAIQKKGGNNQKQQPQKGGKRPPGLKPAAGGVKKAGAGGGKGTPKVLTVPRPKKLSLKPGGGNAPKRVTDAKPFRGRRGAAAAGGNRGTFRAGPASQAHRQRGPAGARRGGGGFGQGGGRRPNDRHVNLGSTFDSLTAHPSNVRRGPAHGPKNQYGLTMPY